MKAIKKIAIMVCVLIIGIYNLPIINAANNRIEIVQKAKQYLFKNTEGEVVGTLRQEITQQNLVNGEITIELTLNNAKNTEIIYIFNNTNDQTTIDNFKQLTEDIFTGFGTEYVKIGSTLVSSELINKPFKQTISEVASALDELSQESVNTGANLNQAIENALATFSSESDNKIIVLVDGTATPTDLLTQITADFSDTTLIIYTSNTETIDEAISVSNIDDTYTNINNTLIPAKNGTSIVMPLASYIVENFEVSLVGNPDNATLNETTKAIQWNVGDVSTNQIEKISYKLNLKSVIDDSIIGLDLLVNEAPTIIFNGNTVQNTDANQCSPIIKILNEAIENPKTGIVNYIILGSTLLALGAITFVISKNKKIESL